MSQHMIDLGAEDQSSEIARQKNAPEEEPEAEYDRGTHGTSDRESSKTDTRAIDNGTERGTTEKTEKATTTEIGRIPKSVAPRLDSVKHRFQRYPPHQLSQGRNHHTLPLARTSATQQWSRRQQIPHKISRLLPIGPSKLKQHWLRFRRHRASMQPHGAAYFIRAS
ncbi:hypothetical protein BJ508DRAFT_24409 [Ascobolus immersus RN42]|uniref:Uncharacterized protein n=1 Tax=Ascobolus immersus RN42 TaxID=1160509 RepID=A0A3N4HRL7_ASCIM|nr:hypothetical protein BJ508DRAFT_24409 [Ascobolus immersus RN42]